MQFFFSFEVFSGMTAINLSPNILQNRSFRHGSDPDEASTIVVFSFMEPLQSAYKKENVLSGVLNFLLGVQLRL